MKIFATFPAPSFFRTSGLVLTVVTMLLASNAGAQPATEREVREANTAFESALSARNIGAMERIWVQDARATTIHPGAKSAEIGWDAVRRSWVGVFDRFSELTATMRDASVTVAGDVAWVVGIEEVSGKRQDGTTAGYTALATNIFVHQGGRWLMALHQVSRIP